MIQAFGFKIHQDLLWKEKKRIWPYKEILCDGIMTAEKEWESKEESAVCVCVCGVHALVCIS